MTRGAGTAFRPVPGPAFLIHIRHLMF